MTEKEKAAAGYLFDPSADPQNAKDITRCIDLCHAYNQCTPSDFDAKRRILEQIIGRMGKNVVITAPFWCDHGYNISIGDDFYSNHNLVITDGAKVTFGDHVFIAPNCCFTTASMQSMRSSAIEDWKWQSQFKLGTTFGSARGQPYWPALRLGIIP